jgi:Tfp pilus assembly protein PilX
MKTKTKHGSALLLTTILLFVILSMVVSLSYVTVMEQKMSQKTKSSVGSFFNADSGVEWALNKIASSNNSATINTISGLTFNADGSVQCPFGGCNVYFLKQDGTTIKPAELGTLTINDIKAVRSVGSDPNQTTQRAIEAAVAAGTCPSSFNDTGYGYCIQADQNATKIWFDASKYCADTYNARLCSASEWYNACINNKAHNFAAKEWISDWYDISNYDMVTMGGANCQNIQGGQVPAGGDGTFPFRCCRNLN